MAPKNRPQRGSFNTRGRQKVAAQQAGRRAATPPTSSNVLPPGRKGGPASRSPVGRPTAPMERVKVKDLGNSRPSLPAGKAGGAVGTRMDPNAPSFFKAGQKDAASRGSSKSSVRTGYPGADRPSGGRPALPPGAKGGALATTAKGVGRLGRFLRGAGSVAGAGMTALAAGAEAQKILNPKDNIIHDLSNLGIAIENKVNGKDGRRPYSGESAGAVGGNRRRGISSEKAGPPVPQGLPNRNKPTPKPPARDNGAGGAPNPVSRGGDIIRERPSAAVSRPSARSSAPARPAATPSAPKAPPAAAKPAAKAPATPAEPNMFNAPRTGVAKFRTDMNPLGKKIVGTTNFSKSVPSERAFDTNSDYSSSLSIPDKKKRKS